MPDPLAGGDVTDEALLPFGDPTPEAAITTARPRRHRHVWVRRYGADNLGNELRNLPPGCIACGAIQDPAASRRGRNNRSRGNAIEREVGKALTVERLAAETVAYDRGFLDGAGYVQRRMDEAVAAERARIYGLLPTFAKALFAEVPLCTGCDMDHAWEDHIGAIYDRIIDGADDA